MNEKASKEAVPVPAKTIDMQKPDKPYSNVLESAEAGELLLFKNKDYNDSLSLGFN